MKSVNLENVIKFSVLLILMLLSQVKKLKLLFSNYFNIICKQFLGNIIAI